MNKLLIAGQVRSLIQLKTTYKKRKWFCNTYVQMVYYRTLRTRFFSRKVLILSLYKRDMNNEYDLFRLVIISCAMNQYHLIMPNILYIAVSPD